MSRLDLAKNKITHDRVFAAADSLYKQAGRVRFPTVAAVRRAAGINMANAIAGMAQWRDAQTAALTALWASDERHDPEAAPGMAAWMASMDATQIRIAELEARLAAQDRVNESLSAAQSVWTANMDAAQIRIAELEARLAAYGRTSTADTDELRAQPHIDPAVSVPTDSQPPATSPRPVKKVANPSGFDEFWRTYPRKVGKPDAIKAWKKAGTELPDTDSLTQSIENQKVSDQWTRNNGAFIPYPATWLNRQGWNDELPKPGVDNGPTSHHQRRKACADAIFGRGPVARTITGSSTAVDTGDFPADWDDVRIALSGPLERYVSGRNRI